MDVESRWTAKLQKDYALTQIIDHQISVPFVILESGVKYVKKV